MKKLFFCLMLLLNSVNIFSQSRYDINRDGKVNVEDISYLTDVILGKIDTIPKLLSGKFTVNSSGKQVQFTRGNLYWDGSTFKLEATQIASSQGSDGAAYDANHISHFFWASLADYQSGNDYYLPYAICYQYSSQSPTDIFWCGKENPLTIGDTNGLYALSGKSGGEWDYLINTRANASDLRKYGVTVTDDATTAVSCLIIAPDDFDYANNALKSSYTLKEINDLGLVCLPAVGYRDQNKLYYSGFTGYYWSDTPCTNDAAYYLDIFKSSVRTTSKYYRKYGYSLRLVRNI